MNFLKQFFTRIIKSRIYDPKNMLKLLIRKNRTVLKKGNSIIDKLLFNDIYTTFEIDKCLMCSIFSTYRWHEKNIESFALFPR